MKSKKAFRELLYRLRTEGGTPGRVAAAVGFGVFIGCSPFIGFHLALCILVARIFRLNQALTYLASHISFPGLLPLILFLDVQIGRLLRHEHLLTAHQHLPEVSWRIILNWQMISDAIVGSIPLGLVLGTAFALPTYHLARRRSREPERHALIEEAAYRYLDSGMFHWEFVRGKLRHDPVYFHLLRPGVLPLRPGDRLLDLGCGRGIVFALLQSARGRAERGEYPAAWGAPPPPGLHYYGIEGSAKMVDVACRALAPEAHIEEDDLTTAPLPAANTVLLLDVLHYLAATAQEDLLSRIAAALPSGGHLLLRDADAAAGWRFTATRFQERLCALARRHWRQRFHYRSRAEWSRLLEGLGFEVLAEPMAEGTPYANVLLTARKG